MDTQNNFPTVETSENDPFTLEQIVLDHDIELRFMDGTRTLCTKLYGGTRFSNGDEVRIDEPTTLIRLIRCLHMELLRIETSDQNCLVIVFQDQTTIVQQFSDMFESWELSSDTGERWLCGPGGQVSHWN